MLLAVVLSNGWLFLFALFVLVIIIMLRINFVELQNQVDEFKHKANETQKNILEVQQKAFDAQSAATAQLNLNNEQKLIFQKTESDLRLKANQMANELFETFKLNEIERIKTLLAANATQSAQNSLVVWKQENEQRIRLDAINRSLSVNLGKISEHLLPFHAKFTFNPKDARFIGSPIDLIVFDGLAEGNDHLVIYFIEVKTGTSKLSETQIKIKSAVEHKRVLWAEINPAKL